VDAPFLLVRIDDRLIHGQVTVAWGTWLEPDRIVLANDEIAATPWRRELYTDSDTLGAAVSVLSVAGLCEAVREQRWKDEKLIVVVESPADLLRLMDGGVAVPCANVGGMHFAAGKRELLPYVYVDDGDLAALTTVASRGTGLSAQDVPQTSPVDLVPILADLEREQRRKDPNARA
jgi:mannose/fructose/N-acetylgalactosamine-specific phosphotransferase system component IIB